MNDTTAPPSTPPDQPTDQTPDQPTDQTPDQPPARVSRSFQLPRALMDDVTSYARAHDITATAVVRTALEQYLRPATAPITREDLATFFSELQRSIEAVHVSALPPTPDPPDPPKKRGIIARLMRRT